MPVPITDDERAAIKIGTTGGKVLESSYWRTKANRNDPDQQIKYIHDNIRFAGLNGQKSEMFAAIKEAEALAEELRSKPLRFRGCRTDIVNLGADLLRFGEAGDDLLRFVPGNKQVPRQRATSSRLKAFGTKFRPVFAPALQWLAGAQGPDSIEQADLGIVMGFSALAMATEDESDLFLTRYYTLDSAVRLAQQAGLRVVAIPDYVFPNLENRPAHMLSFHTAGIFPGFTHFKRGDLPKFMVLDRGGYSGWSTLSGANLADLPLPPHEEAAATCNILREQIVAANVSAYRQDDLTAEADPLPETYVFVPLQVTGDRTQLVARFTMDEMLDIVLQRFAGTDVAVVVKPHPKDTDMNKLAKLVVLAEGGKIVLRFDSIHHLIAQSKAVITVNSGVGSETLLHGKPIYCFGAADYDAVAHRIVSAEQFAALTDPIHPAVSDTDLTRFSAFYRKSYLVEWEVPGRMDQAIQERVIDPILSSR